MRVLFLDDDLRRWAAFQPSALTFEVVHAKTATEALSKLEDDDFDVVCLDHDLVEDYYQGPPHNEHDHRCGCVVAEQLAEDAYYGLVIVHSYNGDAAAKMVRVLRGAGVSALKVPFNPPVMAHLIYEESLVQKPPLTNKNESPA